MSETAVDLGGDEEEAKAILEGIDRVSRQLDIPELFEGILERGDRRRARQRRMDEIAKAQAQLTRWFTEKVLKNRMVVDTEKVSSVRWDRQNGIFADVLLRADEPVEDDQDESNHSEAGAYSRNGSENSSQRSDTIPIGPMAVQSRSQSRSRPPRRSVLFPAHRAMLLRSEFFSTMFASSFREAQVSDDYLQIVSVDCSPAVLEVVLQFLYTEKADFDLSIAIDVLFAADLLFIEKLKTRAAMIISSLGSGGGEAAAAVPRDDIVVGRGGTGLEEVVDIYDVVRAGWMTRVHRLEEFGARYIAYRLENYVDEEEFAELVKESAQRVKNRQETDTVELIDE
jgi:ankyrin repeat and BTB/POZ domain-containing protein 1